MIDLNCTQHCGNQRLQLTVNTVNNVCNKLHYLQCVIMLLYVWHKVIQSKRVHSVQYCRVLCYKQMYVFTPLIQRNCKGGLQVIFNIFLLYSTILIVPNLFRLHPRVCAGGTKEEVSGAGHDHKQGTKVGVGHIIERGISKVVLLHLYKSFHTLTSGNKLN